MLWLCVSTSWVIKCRCSSYNWNNMWHLYTLPKVHIHSFLIEAHTHLWRCLTGLIISCVGRNQELFWICFYAPFNSVLFICSWMIPLLVTVKLLHQTLTEKRILPCPLQCRSMNRNFQSAWVSLLFWRPKIFEVLPNCLKSVRLLWKAANEKA